MQQINLMYVLWEKKINSSFIAFYSQLSMICYSKIWGEIESALALQQ